jgi:hypothetical protein
MDCPGVESSVSEPVNVAATIDALATVPGILIKYEFLWAVLLCRSSTTFMRACYVRHKTIQLQARQQLIAHILRNRLTWPTQGNSTSRLTGRGKAIQVLLWYTIVATAQQRHVTLAEHDFSSLRRTPLPCETLRLPSQRIAVAFTANVLVCKPTSAFIRRFSAQAARACTMMRLFVRVENRRGCRADTSGRFWTGSGMQHVGWGR